MQTTEERFRLTGKSAAYRVTAPGLLGKVLAFVTGAVLLVVGVMFSLLVLAVAATAALLILGYVWWNTRELRKQLRERPPGGHVIEGEVIRDR